MKWLGFFLLIMISLFSSACSSSAVDGNNTINEQQNIKLDENNTINEQQNIKIEKIAPQPIIYHDDANIPSLQSGYGTFGFYSVGTKSITNSSYAGNLQTTLYYPKELSHSRPTLFFYAGAGVYNANTYKGLFYFVASKGYNIIFLTYSNYSLRPLPSATQEALTAFDSHVDRSKVGFIGHSMGAAVTFWMINELSELGGDARILFPMASGYSAFNAYNMIPHDKTIVVPENTKMIQQIYAKDYTTDIRIGIDLYLNNSILEKDKDFMFVYGDSNHSADHGSMATRGGHDVNAMMQRTIFRPLDALMDEAFNKNMQAREQLYKELREDSYFNPYIGKTPHVDIRPYVLPEENYPFNCSEGGTIESIRKEYCKALGL